jgi:beta-lysine 5,6-aminomutase beta subunit
MGGGLYSTDKKEFDTNLDLTRIKPYGDTMNDGKIQISFTLPIEDGDNAIYAAIELSKKMGIEDPSVAYHKSLDENFTFFIIYGELIHSVDATKIKAKSVKVESMTIEEINQYIEENIKRKLIVIGATTGTDAHTVGIDAIMNRKGFAGHYGLERYEKIETYNMGSQVSNEEFIKKAIELKADVLLVSQTVTQKNIHVGNLTNLVELLEAEGIREKIILICGGSRITNELAKELGYDAGFGPGTYGDVVATFFIKEIVRRKIL